MLARVRTTNAVQHFKRIIIIFFNFLLFFKERERELKKKTNDCTEKPWELW